jgi:hypothetical protein
MAGDRYEPHPDLSQLPAYLWRRSPRAAKVAAGAAVCAGIALGIAVAPGIHESKEERAQAEREAAARERARPNRYACLAVTADIPAGPSNEAGQIGYPFRAVVDPHRGRFTLCRIAGRAAEGAITDAPVVSVPPACGGDR